VTSATKPALRIQPGVALAVGGTGVGVAGTGVPVAGGGSVLMRTPLSAGGVSVGAGVGLAGVVLQATSDKADTTATANGIHCRVIMAFI
jgi:hypothetical protein